MLLFNAYNIPFIFIIFYNPFSGTFKHIIYIYLAKKAEPCCSAFQKQYYHLSTSSFFYFRIRTVNFLPTLTFHNGADPEGIFVILFQFFSFI